ncbi:MAG: hypothetical protein ACOZAO_05480 [Patescibacteria group bacterium]
MPKLSHYRKVFLITVFTAISFIAIGLLTPNTTFAGCGDPAPCWHLCGDPLPGGCSNGCCCQPGAPDYGDGIPTSEGGTCSCCSGGGGTPSDTRRVIGRIYDDFTGSTRLWQRASASCGGSYQTDSSNTVTVSNSGGSTASWACNPEPYYIRAAASDGAGPHSFTLTPPPGYTCVSWFISYPLGAYTNTSGTGCTATVSLGADDWDNHLWFKVQPANVAPTASITSPATPYFVNSGGSVTFNVTASDTDGNLSLGQLWRREIDPVSGTWLGSWIQIQSNVSCSGSTCNFSRTWNSIPLADQGSWIIATNASDTSSVWCTGNPGTDPLNPAPYPTENVAGFANCGDNSRILITVNSPPTSEILAPVEDTFDSPTNRLVVRSGETINLTLRANDAGGNLEYSSLQRILFDEVNDTRLAAPIAVGATQSCSGTSCTYGRTWTPAASGSDAGFWMLEVDSRDIYAPGGSGAGTCSGTSCVNTRCTGNPYNHLIPTGSFLNPPAYPVSPWASSGWSNCGNNSHLAVEVVGVTDVRGWLWDSTDQVCSTSDKGTLELNSIAVDGISVSSPPINGSLSLDGSSNYPSYNINLVPVENGLSVCVDLSEYAQQANATYSLTCVEGPNGSGPLSGNCALLNLDPSTSPVDIHLGFDLASSGWFTAVDGDIFVGCSSCTESVSQAIPDPALVTAAGFSPYLVSGLGNLFSNDDVSVNSGTSFFAESDMFIRNLNTSSPTWPVSYTFLPPENAIELTGGDCVGMFTARILDPDEVYYASSSCVQSGIDALGTQPQGQRFYRLTNGASGVATIYITGSSTVTFGAGETSGSANNRFFRSALVNSTRIMFISQVPIVISQDLGKSFGTAEPTETTRPFIEAGFISQAPITFESTNDVETEKTVILEGPIVVGGSTDTIVFAKDRGLNNDKPSVLVKYNPAYLVDLTNQERSGNNSVSNYSGLFVSPVFWE